ncbi:MAG: NAD(P)-dependent oxidoreductase [Acidobacteriia bacterium]|nr:NAD(P)-dependent oxidoreductase [Terriglobia bacterium]MBV8904026.1 NAD(P)-dependent oxidoreductase [Terriglobia bacterium]
MKIALFGAGGTIGQRILKEALNRSHEVTVFARDPSKITGAPAVKADVLDSFGVATEIRGYDLVISAIGPRAGEDVQIVPKAATALIAAVKQTSVPRLLVVGGAGSLQVEPGVQLVDTPQFPAAWRGIAIAHRDALDIYRNCDIDWTYFSPAIFIQPGERTGRYRVGSDEVLMDSTGQSRISAEDYAVAILDEVENPKLSRRRVTIAY